MTMLPLKAASKKQRSVIHFLWTKAFCPNATHSEMHPAYCNKSCKTSDTCLVYEVHLWTRKCCWWKRPGRCVVLTADAVITAVNW